MLRLPCLPLTQCRARFARLTAGRSDLCFIPSAEFERAARMRGLTPAQLRLHGLPVRPAFAHQRKISSPAKLAALADSLGLLPDRKTVLVVGGGDGVGNLGSIVVALGHRLAERNAAIGGHGAQMVVICGKNHRLRQELRERDWGPHLHVVVEGFVTRMPDYMTIADTIVTKAGPGTIAEACCCGLPIMISGYLPGQETGNVDFVVNGGFGDYSSKPERIAATVSSWLEDDRLLQQMSERSLAASRPGATDAIADDIATLVQSTDGAAPAPGAYRARARALGMMSPLSASASAPSDSHRGRAPAPRPLGHSDVPRQPTPTPAEFASAGI